MGGVASTHDDDGASFTEFRQALRERLGESPPLDRGLRERKKQLMRQLISDTATMLFLERGFDEVRVSEVAAACEVSEKTIYNYFPTKESLVFDREEASAHALRRALGPEATHASPVDAVIAILSDEMDEFVRYLKTTDPSHYLEIIRFNDLIERTPALKNARADMTDRLAQVAAEALAARVGVDPNDPEPQIAADALLGLWRVYYRAIVRYSSPSRNAEAIRDAVLEDVRRAGRLINSGLWSFTAVTTGAKGRQEFRAAADASDEARRQVLVALKEAREAWRLLKSSKEARHEEEAQAARTRARDARLAAEEIRRQAHRQRQEIRDAARQAKGRGRAR